MPSHYRPSKARITRSEPGKQYHPSFFIKAKGWKSGYQVTRENTSYATPRQARAAAMREIHKFKREHPDQKVTKSSAHVVSAPKKLF